MNNFTILCHFYVFFLLVLKIFEDMNAYMEKENEYEKKEILKIYGMDMKGSSLKRGRSQKESCYFYFSFCWT